MVKFGNSARIRGKLAVNGLTINYKELDCVVYVITIIANDVIKEQSLNFGKNQPKQTVDLEV